MDEFLELRVLEKNAHLVFGPAEGTKMPSGFIRKVVIRTDDSRLPMISQLRRELHARNEMLFAGWHFIRKYSSTELEAAELFHMQITAVFEPAGEECGTVYDWSVGCPVCGAGRVARDGLSLNLRKAPRSKDISRTIARDEWIVSQRLAEVLVDAGLTGLELRPVRHLGAPATVDCQSSVAGRELLQRAAAAGLKDGTAPFSVWLNREEQRDLLSAAMAARSEAVAMRRHATARTVPVWYQLIITSPALRLSATTRFGSQPFDLGESREDVCPMGDTLGMGLISPAYIRHEQVVEHDFMRTAECSGTRRGILVPHPEILISPRAFRLLREHRIKGFEADVAYRDQSGR